MATAPPSRAPRATGCCNFPDRHADRLASHGVVECGCAFVSIRRHADRLASHGKGTSDMPVSFNPPSCGQAGQLALTRFGKRLRFNPPSCGQAGQRRAASELAPKFVSIRRHADRLASFTLDRAVTLYCFNPPSCGQAGQRESRWGTSSSSFNPPSCGQAGQPSIPLGIPVSQFQSAVMRTGWPAKAQGAPGGEGAVSIRRHADRLASMAPAVITENRVSIRRHADRLASSAPGSY